MLYVSQAPEKKKNNEYFNTKPIRLAVRWWIPVKKEKKIYSSRLEMGLPGFRMSKTRPRVLMEPSQLTALPRGDLISMQSLLPYAGTHLILQ